MPKVYDKDGRELTVGARVERVLPNGKLGGLPGRYVGLSGGHRDVAVEWDCRSGVNVGFIATRRRAPFTRSLTCDLLLIYSPTEGKEG